MIINMYCCMSFKHNNITTKGKKEKSNYLFIKYNNKKILVFPCKTNPHTKREWEVGILYGIKLLYKNNLIPRIGIISGGRKEDVGRSQYIDETLAISSMIYNLFYKKGYIIKSVERGDLLTLKNNAGVA